MTTTLIIIQGIMPKNYEDLENIAGVDKLSNENNDQNND